MKVISFDQLMEDFDNIIDDVGDNKQYYQIQTENGDCILMPYDEYNELSSNLEQETNKTCNQT